MISVELYKKRHNPNNYSESDPDESDLLEDPDLELDLDRNTTFCLGDLLGEVVDDTLDESSSLIGCGFLTFGGDLSVTTTKTQRHNI